MAETERIPGVTEPEALPRMSSEDMAKILAAIEEKKSDETVRLTRRMATSSVITAALMGIYTLATIFLWIINDKTLGETRKSNETAVKALAQTRRSNETSENALTETKRSNAIAEEALAESKKSNDMAIYDFKLKNRPYMAANSFGRKRDEEKREIGIQINLKNFGNVAAEMIEKEAKVFINGVEQEFEDLVEAKGDFLEDSNTSFFPQVEYNTNIWIDDHKGVYSKIVDKKEKLEVICKLTYKSTIDETKGSAYYRMRYYIHEKPDDDYLSVYYSKFK